MNPFSSARDFTLRIDRFFIMVSYLFSCEHATCAVPEPHREVFRGREDRVSSTEGWEPGSLNLAQGFAMKFRTPLVHGDVTRLLVDLEQEGDARWSDLSAALPEATRVKLEDRHWRPYRVLLKQRISEDLRRYDEVLHVMIHTDPEADGTVVLETMPDSPLAEKAAASWRGRLAEAGLDARHQRAVEISPLARGLADGFSASYGPIRLKVAQSFFLEGRPLRWETLKKTLLNTLAADAA